MLHIAMFEAVNAIDRRYAPYKLNLSADRAASREAAAAAAAYDVLLALHPDKKADLDATLAGSLAGIAENEAKSKGIELGKQAAAGIIALRANDGSNTPEDYRPATTAGVYVPTTIPIESTSSKIKPFAMTSASQFRAAPPPALTSETWTRDLNEIREIGSREAPSARPSRRRSPASGSSPDPGPTIRSSARSPRTGRWTSSIAPASMR